MLDHPTVCRKIAGLFMQELDINVPSTDTDLIDTGLLNSLVFIELLLQLEQNFQIQISLQDFEIDDFRSIKNIAEFVLHQNGFGVNVDSSLPH